jgi:hypothetical protein
MTAGIVRYVVYGVHAGRDGHQDCSDVSSSKDDVDQSKQKYSVTCHHFLYCSDVSR